jgi:hypothetical protein
MNSVDREDFDPHDLELVNVGVTVDDFPKEVIFENKDDEAAKIFEEAAEQIAKKSIGMEFISARYLKPTFQIMKDDPTHAGKLVVFGKVEVYYIPKGEKDG